MATTFYTIWKAKKDSSDDAILLESEPIFHTKRRAFKRAEKLAKELIVGWNFVILVRKIRTDTDMCLEWEFGAE